MFQKIKKHHDFMWGYTLSLLRGLSRPAFVFLAFISGSIILVTSFGFHHFNPQENLGVSDYVDVLYFVVTTITGVGFGDITPKTHVAKLVTMGLMLVGTALYVCFTATLATLILDVELRKEK
jgi:hypothetical protein